MKKDRVDWMTCSKCGKSQEHGTIYVIGGKAYCRKCKPKKRQHQEDTLARAVNRINKYAKEKEESK